jgi:RNA polymerase sigma-70 factor, ECF subfamily
MAARPARRWQPTLGSRTNADNSISRSHVPAGRSEPETFAEAGPGLPDRDIADGPLLSRAGRGDVVAFRTLVDRHLTSMLRIARRMLSEDTEAEDIAQEAMLRLWRAASTLQVGAGGVRPWLRRVVSNLCLDRIRAGQRTEVMDAVPEQEAPATQLQWLADVELSARVDAALKALPERQRLALTLFHYEELSQGEVGKIMGVSEEAVESLLARARRALKVSLREDWRRLLSE